MRIACLLVPDLPLRAELRAHPELAGRPFVLASGQQAQAEVIAASPEAAEAGVAPPCSLAQARSLCANLHTRVASPALDEVVRDTLNDLALSFSPRIAPAPRAAGLFVCEGAVWLDAKGVNSLFHSEAGFASALSARAEMLGLPGFIAIASSRGVAQLIARQLALPRALGGTGSSEENICVLKPGAEADALSNLPIDLLDPSGDLAQSLSRFGVRSVGELLRLPRRALAQRVGPEVLRLISRARGEAIEPPLPEPRSTRFREAIDLDSPIAQLQPLSFVLRGLLSHLTQRLALRGLACGPLNLEFELEGGGRDARRIGVAAPTRDPRVLLRLVERSLESHPPEAPVEGVCLRADALRCRVDQLDLFRPAGPDPSELDRTLAKLESLCGAGRVGAPTVLDDHRPGVFGMTSFAQSTSKSRRVPDAEREKALTSARSLAVCALRPAVRAEVRVHRGLPSQIRSAVASGHVLQAAGPWRTTGRWWSENERYALDHYDVQVSDGTTLSLCFDWLRRDWQIDAVYD